MATANDFTIRLPGVTSNLPNESPLASLLRRRALLDPMSQAMWDADPRNQAEITRLRREEAGLPPETIPGSGASLVPNQPPPGGWTDTNTYDDIFGTPPAPPVVPPSRPGAVPGSVWNNPDSEAPRGYNPELWAQREIGPNRTYSGGVTGMGIGGPTNQDGTAMYTPPPEVKATRNVDGMGYEPANLFQREKFEGQFSGGPDVLTNMQGNTFERNLLASIAEAAANPDPAVSGRAKFILAAASNPAMIRDMPFTAQSQLVGPNLIDRAGYQYDMENGGGPQRRQPAAKPEGEMGKNRDRGNPFMNRMGDGTMRYAKGTMDRRAPTRMPIVEYAGPPPGPMFPEVDTTVYPSTYAWAIDKGIDPWSAKNQRQGMRELGTTRPVKRYPNGTVNMNPFMSAFTNPMPTPMRRVAPVAKVPMTPAMASGRLPVYGMPGERMPMDPQRRPVLVGQPHANPFLMGGANRVNGNPFRR